MDAELAAALIMFERGDPDDIAAERARLRRLHATSGVRVPDGVEILDLEPSHPSAPPVRVRMYRPRRRQAPSTCLLWLHGGAFAYGFAELDDDLCVRLAADADALVVSPEYRLSPEHPFPAGFDDCYATLAWLAREAHRFDGDAGALAVGGSSAGGALAAGVCLRARDEGGPAIRQQILACPVIDDRLQTASMRTYTDSAVFDRREAELMWQRYLGPQHGSPPRYAAPGREADLRGLPPAYVLTAAEDPLRDEGVDYAVRLLAAGNTLELHHVAETFHSFDSIVPTAGVSQRVYADYVAALRRCRTGAP